MSRFSEAFAGSGFGQLMGMFGEAVVYTPLGGEGVEIWGIFDSGSLDLEDRDGDRGLVEAGRGRLTVGTDPSFAVYGGVSGPRVKDRVSVGGVVWVVVGYRDKQVGMVELELERSVTVESTAGGVRV